MIRSAETNKRKGDNEMKEPFVEPEVDVVVLDKVDIICTSCQMLPNPGPNETGELDV